MRHALQNEGGKVPDGSNALREARLATGWSQARLIAAMRDAARRLHISLPGDETLTTNVRRWENGRVRPGQEYRHLFRVVYGMTDHQLGFSPPDGNSDRQPRIAPSFLSGEALDYFGSLLNEHVRADNLMGSGFILDVVGYQVTTLATAAREARGTRRRPVIAMACRYHEFYGWLLQDAGRCGDAMASTDRACDFATELGDSPLTAYLMMRKSNIATDASDPALAAGLADAALATHDKRLTPKVRAVLLRQKANAYAGLGQADECASAIDEAFAVAARDDPDGAELAGYCTPGYVAMEAGTCWLGLGQPDRALTAFSQATAPWDPALRRDQGLGLARLAAAHAGAGDIPTSCRTARAAVVIAAAIGSMRTLMELRRLRSQLVPHIRDPEVAAVCQAIASLVAAAA